MITEERKNSITLLLQDIDLVVHEYINKMQPTKFTEEEVFHMRQIFGQRLRRHTTYGDTIKT